MFALCQENIVRHLKEGKAGIADGDSRDFFFNAMSEAATKIGTRRSATIDLDFRRTVEAQADWKTDMKRLIDDKRIDQSELPCHIKHAAFLCYWLRRRQIVRDISGSEITSQHLRHYPNEFVAARTSLILLFFCHYFQPGADIDKILGQLEDRFPNEFFEEFVIMLRYKNVSPHSIYLIFKALVTPVVPPVVGIGPGVTSLR